MSCFIDIVVLQIIYIPQREKHNFFAEKLYFFNDFYKDTFAPYLLLEKILLHVILSLTAKKAYWKTYDET